MAASTPRWWPGPGPVLQEVADATAALHDDLADRDRRSVWQIPPVLEGLDDVTEAVGDAEGSARTGALAAELGPALLGADGEARYFVAFVSPSEARGTGFLGNYGILTLTDGAVDLVEVGRNDELNTAGAPVKVISGPPTTSSATPASSPSRRGRTSPSRPTGPPPARSWPSSTSSPAAPRSTASSASTPPACPASSA